MKPCPECEGHSGYLDPSCQLCCGNGMITDDLACEDFEDDDNTPECFGEYAPGTSICDWCEYQEECK
jgi:hypothetical protein